MPEGVEQADRSDLGMVVSGSLSEGLEVRLNAETSVEDMAVGRYVVIEGAQRRFFAMVTDVRLGAASPQLAASPPDVSDPFVAEVLTGTGIYGTLALQPMLTLADGDAGPQPVKTVPTHYSRVREANEEDVSLVFGAEDETHYYIGQPLDMDTPVCVDLKRLVERSSGVFGKSGTGKTFLTRLLLIGIVQREIAVNLVFDMHSEYGWAGTSEGSGRFVKGLKQMFPARIAIFTLDPESSLNRGAHPDHVVEIGYDQVEPDDIAMLREALGMTEAQIESIIRIARKYGDNKWLRRFLELEGDERDALATELGLNPGTLMVLHRKMQTRLARLSFMKEQAAGNSVQAILDCLQRGIHVVLEFGRHRSLDAYILVANILTRRIHERYVEAVELAMGNRVKEPRPLVITIEEAHKFLNPRVADFTIFGTIAREMRKFNVTLLVVDQRPSSIADEIMSQIGTRITCLLDNEHDINAVLTGISGAQSLRGVLARLDSKQQALLLGHAVPMPVVIRTRDYGTPESYAAFQQFAEAAGLHRQALRSLRDLYDER
ncbi:MAG: ATP-binding protein [Chloroflexi bacterium]|nr:ATP-binding protein [Chloroflexota bacterium]